MQSDFTSSAAVKLATEAARHPVAFSDLVSAAEEARRAHAAHLARCDAARFAPERERSWSDHDEPWQYQPYHLSDREKFLLLKGRERMLAGEGVLR